MTTTKWPAYSTVGELVGYHVRVDLEGGGKNITWEGPTGGKGLGGFPTKALALYEPSTPVPESRFIVLCEGEKAADACASVGIRALGTVCGASSIPSRESLAVLLEGGVVVLLFPDNDTAGRNHMSSMAAELIDMGATDVRTINWAAAPPKGDAADAVEMGEDIEKLISNADPLGPVYTQDGSVWYIKWSNLPITVEIRGADKPKGGPFKVQVRVFYNGRRIHRSNPTLDSTSGMDQLRRTLERRLPGEDIGADWGQLVEEIASVQDVVQQGSPSVVLGEVEHNGNQIFHIEPVLIRGEPQILWSAGGVGKSFFSLYLCTLAQEGITSSDLVVEPSRCLILDYETSQQSMANRLNKIHKGLGIDSTSKVRYKRMYQRLESDIDYVRDEVAEHDIDLVIIDSMGMACGELESAEPVLNFFSAVNSLGCTSLILSHATKMGELYGSAYTQAAARSIWEAKQGEGKYGSSMDFTIFHRKANDVALQPSMSWRIEYTEDMTKYTRVDVMETDSAGTLSYVDLVFRLLAEEPSTPRSRGYLEMAIADIKREHSSDQLTRNVAVAISRQKKRGALHEQDGKFLLANQAIEEVLE